MTSTPSFLITGATGKQGGAVVDALLSSLGDSDTISILAVTRNPESESAKRLVAKSPQLITLVKGDLNDCPAIFAAVPSSVQRVFCVSNPQMGFRAVADGEEVQAMALVDAALEAGVEHFVFTSVDRHGADSDRNPTDVPHFIAKARIEKHLREKTSQAQMTWTVLRPVAFMDNITPGFAGKIFPTTWKVGLSPSTKLQLVATADIGYFGAQALLRPAKFAGRAISIAGDELTFAEANAIFREATGQEFPTTYWFIGSFLLWAIKDVGLMFRFFDQVGYAANIEALRKEHPGLQSLQNWVDKSVFVAKK